MLFLKNLLNASTQGSIYTFLCSVSKGILSIIITQDLVIWAFYDWVSLREHLRCMIDSGFCLVVSLLYPRVVRVNFGNLIKNSKFIFSKFNIFCLALILTISSISVSCIFHRFLTIFKVKMFSLKNVYSRKLAHSYHIPFNWWRPLQVLCSTVEYSVISTVQ